MTIHKPDDPVPVLFEFDEAAPNFKRRVFVRIRVGEVELLGWEKDDGTIDPWWPVWIHSFATSGLMCLMVSKRFRASGITFTDTEGFDFKTEGERLQIYSDLAGQTVEIDFDTFFKAWQDFAKKVYEVVVCRQPEFLAYPSWAAIDDPVKESRRSQSESAEAKWFEEDDGTHPTIYD